MSGLKYKKLGSTLSNICNTTQLNEVTKCHYAFKNFWGELWYIKFETINLYFIAWPRIMKIGQIENRLKLHQNWFHRHEILYLK